MTEYNFYCDESCHLRRDKNNIMVLGGMYCPADAAKSINKDIIDIKVSHGWNAKTEIKWTQIAPSNVKLFLDLVDYFFDNHALSFRGYIARGKNELNLDDIEYNDWYYKLYYRMFEFVLDKHKMENFNFYLDIKDTVGYEKVQTLQDYLNIHYHREIVKKAQLVRSDHIALLQLADVFVGALSYKHRRLKTSDSKLMIINRIEELSNEDILTAVPISKTKANWFIWVPDTWR